MAYLALSFHLKKSREPKSSFRFCVRAVQSALETYAKLVRLKIIYNEGKRYMLEVSKLSKNYGKTQAVKNSSTGRS